MWNSRGPFLIFFMNLCGEYQNILDEVEGEGIDYETLKR